MYNITTNSKHHMRKQSTVVQVSAEQAVNAVISDTSLYLQINNISSSKAAYAAKKENQNG